MLFEHQVITNTILNRKFNLIKFKSVSPDFKFKIGQFVSLTVNKLIIRSYSVASLPEKLPHWEIFVDITPGGPGTTYLKSLKKGDVVETSEAKGQFLLNNKYRDYIFGATGCGIAPLLPMIEKLTKKDKNRQVHLFWGLRFKKDISLIKLLESIKAKNANFSYGIVLSRADTTWKGDTGHINELILKTANSLRDNNTAVYLSGSRNFVQEAATVLKKNKFPLKKIYLESCY